MVNSIVWVGYASQEWFQLFVTISKEISVIILQGKAEKVAIKPRLNFLPTWTINLKKHVHQTKHTN